MTISWSILLSWLSTRKGLYVLMLKNHIIFSHIILCFSPSSTFLFKAPVLKSPACSDWSAHTSQTVFPCHLCLFFCFYNHGHAEGSEGIVVTSQPNRNPDSTFKGTVSECWSCAFLCIKVKLSPKCNRGFFL